MNAPRTRLGPARALLLCLLVLAGGLLVTRGWWQWGDESAVRTRALEFLEAVAAGDASTVRLLVTDRLRTDFDGRADDESWGPSPSPRLVPITTRIDGEAASATVRMTDSGAEFVVRVEFVRTDDDNWLIDGVTYLTPLELTDNEQTPADGERLTEELFERLSRDGESATP